MKWWTHLVLFLICVAVMAEASNKTWNDTEDLTSTCSQGKCIEARTFGIGKRRMGFFMLPVMFKLGVMVTLLVGLTVMSSKGLVIGVILLIIACGGLFSKWKGDYAYGPPPPPPIHVHVPDKWGGGGYQYGYPQETYRSSDVPASPSPTAPLMMMMRRGDLFSRKFPSYRGKTKH